jgi:hypothetical protein
MGINDESLWSDYRDELYMGDFMRPAFSQPADFGKAKAIVYSDSVMLKTPKDQNFIDALKGVFRWHEREWRPSETAWIVYGSDNIENACNLLLMFFPDGIIDRGYDETAMPEL